MADPRAASTSLHLSWLGTLCGALLVLLSDVLPVPLGFVRPETLFRCLLEIEVAFILLVWPMFVLSRIPEGERVRRSTPGLLVQILLLRLAALPPALMGANMSSVGPGGFLEAEALMVALTLAAAALFALARQERWEAAGPWYVAGVFVLSAAVPFVAFGVSSVLGADLSWTAVLSPFWAAGRGEGASPILSAAIFAGLAAVGGAAGALRKGVAA